MIDTSYYTNHFVKKMVHIGTHIMVHIMVGTKYRDMIDMIEKVVKIDCTILELYRL